VCYLTRTTHVLTTLSAKALDSVAQSCGLSLPTLTQTKDRLMLDELDSLTGDCGVSLPTLFKRTGSMAAHGQLPLIGFPPRACSACSAGSACGGPSLPDTPATRNAGPEVRPRPPVKATATAIASRTGRGLGNQDTDGRAKGFTGPSPEPAHAANRRVPRGPPAKTTPTSIASGPGRAPSQARGLDNWIRMGIAKPSRGPIDGPAARRVPPRHRLFWREPMTARASPIG
jgi:hypothetical protein